MHIHSHTHRLQDIIQTPWLWVFISLSFSFSSFIILSPLMLSPSASILSRLSFPALLFFTISPSLLYSVSHSSSPPFFPSLSLSFISTPLSLTRSLALSPSLRLAVFIFQSFISTNVRQCFCPPSIDPQRERRRWGERRKEEKRRGKAATRNRGGKERDIEGGVASKRAGMRWGKERKSRIKSVKGGESLQYFNHSFSQITEQPWTDSGSPLLSPPNLFPRYASPLLCSPCQLIVQISLHQLKYRYQDKMNNSTRTDR